MQRLAFYGKGGIGKSTIATNVSVGLARSGRRVLHVGCDPKRDSTVALMHGRMIPTVLERSFGAFVGPDEIVAVSPDGVHCAEAGGPQAGVGCAGRGISRTLEIFDRAGLLSPDRYDVVTFDVLGDVVCGGFAAPLRRGVGEKVVIVASEEVMSLYAANNIAKAVVTYAQNGVVCAGMVLNVRDPDGRAEAARRFAALLNLRVLGVVPRDPLVREAEYHRTAVAAHAPDSPIARTLSALGERILSISSSDCALPTPMSDEEFHSRTRDRFAFDPAEPRSAGPLAPRRGGLDPPREAGDRVSYRRELLAGREAVRRGLLAPEEAVRRLREAFPRFSSALSPADLT